MIANGNLEIEEQADGTYVYPATDKAMPKYSWALYMFKDSRGADLYTRRGPSGALLGKPIHLPNPEEPDRVFAELIHPYDLCELMETVKVAVVNNNSAYPEGYPDSLIELDGKFYLQTVRVKARTKNIR